MTRRLLTKISALHEKTVHGLLLAFTLTFSLQTLGNEEDLRLTHIQGQVYMLSGAGANVSIQIGEDALVFVDSPAPELFSGTMELVRNISDRPVRYVVSTHLDREHVSGNQLLETMGDAAGIGILGAGNPVAAAGATRGVTIMAHENVLNRYYLTDTDIDDLIINTTYFTPHKDFFMNGEGIMIYHMPRAHTDGDSIVFFRRSDVISTGDIYVQGRYPEIDLERGGSIDGLLAALNFILELMIPGPFQEGGTYVIPGHGRPGDELDVVEYRNMVYIISDRVKTYMERGLDLQQILALRPTRDYDTEYGGHRGGPSPEAFVTAIYQSLQAR